MQSAVVGSYHHDTPNFGGTFRDAAYQQASTSLLYTQPPFHPTQYSSAPNHMIMNHMTPNQINFMSNDMPLNIQAKQQQQMLQHSIQTTKSLIDGSNAQSSQSSDSQGFFTGEKNDSSPTASKSKIKKKKKKVKNPVKPCVTYKKKNKNNAKILPTRAAIFDYDFTRSPLSPGSTATADSETQSQHTVSQILLPDTA